MLFRSSSTGTYSCDQKATSDMVPVDSGRKVVGCCVSGHLRQGDIIAPYLLQRTKPKPRQSSVVHILSGSKLKNITKIVVFGGVPPDRRRSLPGTERVRSTRTNCCMRTTRLLAKHIEYIPHVRRPGLVQQLALAAWKEPTLEAQPEPQGPKSSIRLHSPSRACDVGWSVETVEIAVIPTTEMGSRLDAALPGAVCGSGGTV